MRGCGSGAVSERSERTAQGYQRFRCRACGKQFNERGAGSLNRTQYSSEVIALAGRAAIDRGGGGIAVRLACAMPFKHNGSRRHHIPKARRRITNWPAYESGLRRRGDVTFWLDETALSGWRAPRRTSRGGQPIYSDLASVQRSTGVAEGWQYD